MRVTRPPWLNERLDKVEQLLLEATRSREAVLRHASTRLAASGGKRLRPTLALLAGAFGTVDDPAIIEIAAAIELLHMATLVHDDIIDDSPTRRGQSTVQAAFGKDVAVFTGDFLLTKALLLLCQAKADEQMQELARVMVHICEGEVSQFSTRFQTVDVLRYLKRIHGKTAALFGLSAAAGAKQCDADEDTCRSLARYGVFFGMAFQIHDDILDYGSTDQDIGKPVGQDVLSGIFTLPLLYAIDEADSGPKLHKLLNTARSAEVVAQVVSLVQRSGGLKRAEHLRDRYVQKALSCLETLPASSARDALYQLPGGLFG